MNFTHHVVAVFHTELTNYMIHKIKRKKRFFPPTFGLCLCDQEMHICKMSTKTLKTVGTKFSCRKKKWKKKGHKNIKR